MSGAERAGCVARGEIDPVFAFAQHGADSELVDAADTREEGLVFAAELIREVRDIRGVRGVHLMVLGTDHSRLPELAEVAA